MILITPDTIHTGSYQNQLQFQNPPVSAVRVMPHLRLSSYAANRNLSRNPSRHSCHSCRTSISISIPPSRNQSQNQSQSDHDGGTHHRPRHPLTGPVNPERARASTGATVTATTTTITTTTGHVRRVDRARTRSPPAESGLYPLTLTPSGDTRTRRVTAPATVLATQPTRPLLLETTTTRLNRAAAAARAGTRRRIGEEREEMGRGRMTHEVVSDWFRREWARFGWMRWKL
ncbi:hypothetical protein EDD17DRAFT_1135204 [Pisolithus thermaeus]|nr:hypothetical protein EV401DRAFT_226331 [Pisolithus croceorrhizus]KAI6151467.1 hypothetical protein EDD17DRAFT_1135204 [Pisolithus thermaeus]